MISNILIIFFASISYLIGFYAILTQEYRPNLFTRIVWFGLALNSIVSVIKLHNQGGTIALAWVALLGSLLILIGSIIKKGEQIWGKNESISLVLLIISLLVWIFTDIPLLNLSIGLIAHLIGSLPTVLRVIKNPKSENIPFWLFFAIASIIAFLSTNSVGIKGYLYALYFCIFDGGMVILSLRKYLNKKS